MVVSPVKIEPLNLLIVIAYSDSTAGQEADKRYGWST